MSCLTDLLDFDGTTFEREKIDGGQTEGFVAAPPNPTYNPLIERKRGYGGADYAHVIRQREDEKERIKMKVDIEGENDPMHNVDDLTSMGTIPNVGELDREELTQVYENYDFEPKKTTESMKLAVFDHKDSILNMIRTYRVCVIKGNTGCGKTTQIPQMILDSHFETRKHCNIIVTQPRRIAAISVAKRVSDERNWSLGTIVGYQVGLEKKATEDTRLMYCTTGVLLQRLINSKHMNDYTHVILDEVHERDQDMDFLMLVVRKFQRTVSPHVKIILMSATINTTAFTQYFSSSVTDEAPVLEVGQKTNFPVSIYYLDRLEEKLGQFPDISEDQPRIAEKAYEYVVKIIEAFDIIDDTETKTDVKKKGSVLVFLPGIHEIEMLYEALEMTQLGKNKRIWWICPLHSTITADEQMKAFRVPPAEFRKIILSTNIAESSITVPDIKYVIDFCLTKVMYADPETNLSSLHLAWASKNQCEQRAGRVGRVMAGRVYRLLLKGFYDYCIQDETKPEILRCPLERVVLKSKLLEMGEPMEILALAMDPPDLNRLEQTILILKETGALLMTVNGEYYHLDGDLTWLGRIMAALPLDIKISKLIMLGHIFSILEDTIIMGCAMTVKSMFSKPFKQDLMAYISKLTWADSTCSDSIACLNAYRLWRYCKTSGKFDISAGGGAKSWGKRFFIQLNAMREVARLQDEVTIRLKSQFGIEESKGLNRVKWNKVTRPLIMKIVLAGAFYPHYFVRSQSGGQIDESAAVKVLGGRDPFSTVYLTNFPPNQPGPLYANSIREHFENCGVQKSNIKISFDCSSKVYIEFKGNDYKQPVEGDDRHFTYAIPGKICMAVYRALKMRHYTSSSVHIQVLPSEEAKRRMAEIEEKKLEKKRADKFSVLPSLATSYIEIRISHVNDPGDFYAQYSSMDYHKKLINIHHYLNTVGTLRNLGPTESPQLNKIYAAPFKDPDGTNDYYRARVIHRENQTVKVLFVDYGNVETVHIQALRKFDPILQLDGITELEELDLENEPNLAFNCTLALVQPSLTKNYRAMWSDEANHEFKKLCGQSQKLVAKVYSVCDNVVSLEIYVARLNSHLERRRYEEDARTMVTVNKHLVDRKLAEWNEESYLSKVDHDLRLSHQNSDISYCDGYETSGSAKPLTPSQWTDDGDMPPIPKQQCRKPVRLKGPDSPLEMTVYSCIQSNMKKMVQIEHDSVNSVLLDTHPHDPHERMLIASSVGQSPNGERLTLRYTTLLPNIHGLSALICLLFCPYAEFRINRAATRLTGAICGLGCDPDTNEAFFPENDMEIMFDTTFTMDDILMINKLRYWMSIFLSEGESHNPAEFTDNHTIEHQNKVKELILKLLEQLGQQKTERVESHCEPYRWGQINSNRLLNPGVNSDWAIYHLHYGVSLEEEPKDFTPDARLLKNLGELKQIASGKAPIKGAMCDLCQVSFDNVRSLKLHLQSTQHCELVDSAIF